MDLSAVGNALASIEQHLPPVLKLTPEADDPERRVTGRGVDIIGPIVLLLATQIAGCGTERLDGIVALDLVWGGLAGLLMIAIGFLIARGRAHAQPHFLAVVLISTPCMGVAIPELVFTLNVLLDEPEQMPAVARRAYESDDDYYLEIVEAPLTSRPATIKVFRSVHDAVGHRSDVPVALAVGPGRWGRPWVRGGSTKVLPAE
jgi:hypothetical protein